MSTYTPIASITLASAASSVTFSGIPQTYTDLVLVVAGSGTVAGNMTLQFNSDTGSNYSNTILFGDGSSAGSARASNATSINIGDFDQDSQSNNIVQLQNYSNSTTNKTVLGRGNRVLTSTVAKVGLWRNTTAITSVTVGITGGTTMKSGTTFNLYGIANASITNVAKATGGDSVYTDGTYWYHIFRSSGTFTPTQALTADYLVVAGGGGAGEGGGGAGGLRCTVGTTGGGGSLESALSLTAQAYTVTVGAGGAANVFGTTSSSQGSNSVFSTITATGGGRGGDNINANGGNGGSGGGNRRDGNGTKGTGTANQGYDGGQSVAGGWVGASGGGGAGAAGSAGTGTGSSGGEVGGSGGNGVTTSISGTSTTYAGGGGGGAEGTGGRGSGGSGGGGQGNLGNDTSNTAGTANTGGGGGGANGPKSGRAGGSGIVIVRYAA